MFKNKNKEKKIDKQDDSDKECLMCSIPQEVIDQLKNEGSEETDKQKHN